MEATGYQTTAEKYGWSVVAITNYEFEKVEGANWQKPDGKYVVSDNMPVTQVSWMDACAYCKWAGSRLEGRGEWADAVDWSKPGNTMDNGRGYPVPSTDAGSRLGNVWEWTADGALMGGSFLCSKTSCAGNTREGFIHVPGDLESGCNNIGFRCKPAR